MTPRLELQNISKRYPSVQANDGISLQVMPGEVHAILGENGAGKSTLMKIIYGIVRADEGEIFCNGQPIGVHKPTLSRKLGIEMVHQHFALFESVTVAENIAISFGGKYDIVNLSQQVSEVSERYGLPVNPRSLVHHLSVGERQRVEIVRCLLQNPKVLILDEPTSVLTPQAVSRLFETLRLLAAEGCSILYISHKLYEVKELCDTATVLRDGRVTGTISSKKTSTAEIAQLMVGTDLPQTVKKASKISDEHALVIRNVTTSSEDQFGASLNDISLSVRRGEIVGIAGVSGNGQAELERLISGETTLNDAESIQLFEQPIAHLDAGKRRDLGLAFIPVERLGRGAVPSHRLNENAVLTAYRLNMVENGLLKMNRANRFTEKVIKKFGVKANGLESVASSLSGGNLQKYIVGREIEQNPKFLLVAQPTWGLDVGAAAFVRQTLVNLCNSGTAVLVISEELDELFEICDRLLVLYQGRLSQSFQCNETSLEEIGMLMAGATAVGSDNTRTSVHASSD